MQLTAVAYLLLGKYRQAVILKVLMGDMKRKSETGKEIETEVSGINLDRTITEGLSAKAISFPTRI